MKLTQRQRKLITSLRQKKYRIQHNLFLVEGIKSVTEFLDSHYSLYELFVTDMDIFHNYPVQLISERELNQVSALKSPNKVLAIFEIPKAKALPNETFILALDQVNDPGNLGTIIRLCDWFGIENLLCSLDTVDCYNPKVVQSAMGSLSRVNITYIDLEASLKEMNLPILIADMEGNSIYETELPKKAVLVMGNEANGVSERIRKMGTKVVSIPRFGVQNKTESLNVATATAVILSEFNRTNFLQKQG